MAEKNPTKKKMNGWLALSPLAVFLITYLVTSIVCRDFYKVPVSSAFVLASIYAMLITKGPVNERIGVFSSGAGDRNVLLMIWIFVLAGAFASVAKSIGSVEATVNLTLRILPGKFILAGLFLAACFYLLYSFRKQYIMRLFIQLSGFRIPVNIDSKPVFWFI